MMVGGKDRLFRPNPTWMECPHRQPHQIGNSELPIAIAILEMLISPMRIPGHVTNQDEHRCRATIPSIAFATLPSDVGLNDIQSFLDDRQ
jgi:hypothetical protein